MRVEEGGKEENRIDKCEVGEISQAADKYVSPHHCSQGSVHSKTRELLGIISLSLSRYLYIAHSSCCQWAWRNLAGGRPWLPLCGFHPWRTPKPLLISSNSISVTTSQSSRPQQYFAIFVTSFPSHQTKSILLSAVWCSQSKRWWLLTRRWGLEKWET